MRPPYHDHHKRNSYTEKMMSFYWIDTSYDIHYVIQNYQKE